MGRVVAVIDRNENGRTESRGTWEYGRLYHHTLRARSMSLNISVTEDQILMIKEAAKRSLALGDDNPELTDEQWLYFVAYMRVIAVHIVC